MQRVRALPAARGRPPLPADLVLARMRERNLQERRQARWSMGGGAVGIGIALVIAQAWDASAAAAAGQWVAWLTPLAAIALCSAVLAFIALSETRR